MPKKNKKKQQPQKQQQPQQQQHPDLEQQQQQQPPVIDDQQQCQQQQQSSPPLGAGASSSFSKRQVSFPSDDAIAVVHHLQASSSAGDLSSSTTTTHAEACCGGGEGALPPHHHSSINQQHSTHESRAGCWGRFRAAVKQLKRDVLALYYAVHDPRTPLLSKVLPWLVLAYALSPLDLIPDFIPVLGFLDDMLLLPLGLWLSYKLIPAEVMEDSRARAAAEPLLLHKSWVVASLVFCLWCGGLLLLEHWLIGQYGSPQLQQLEWAVLGGSGGLALLVFVVWAVLRVRHERKRREAAAAGGVGAALLAAAFDSSDEEEGDVLV